MDPYEYVGDDPMVKTDPTGHYIADANGDFAYIDSQWNVSIYIKNNPITSGPGYVYTLFHYTKAQWHTPTPKTPPYDHTLSIGLGGSYESYTLWQHSWGLWGIPLGQNQLIFSDLNSSLTGGIGPSDDGWNFGLSGDANVFDLTEQGVAGNQLLGITHSVDIRGPEVYGQAGWAGKTLGLGVGINPIGSVNGSIGLNIAGVNVSETVSVKYHPSHPQDARLNDEIYWLFFVGLGLLCVLVGLVMYVRGLLSRTKE